MSNSGSAVVGRYGMEIGQLEFVGEPIVFRGWPDAMNLIEIDDRMRVAVLHLDATYRVCNSRFSDTDRSVQEDAINHPTRLSQPLRRTETGPVPEAPFPTIRPRWSRHHGLRPASCDPRPATRRNIFLPEFGPKKDSGTAGKFDISELGVARYFNKCPRPVRSN